MSVPKIAGLAPVKVTLEEGKNYAFCTCGLSVTQPFCDGAHKGTGMSPHKFTASQSEEVWMCLCKHSQKGMCCDGTHKTLSNEPS